MKPERKAVLCHYFVCVFLMAVEGCSAQNSGGLDTSFSPSPGVSGTLGASDVPAVTSIFCQRDGNILVGGAFNLYAGAGQAGLVRALPDGKRDTNFTFASCPGGTSALVCSLPSHGANDAVQCVVEQQDGKILVGGWFTQVGLFARHGIARLNHDGSLDTNFAGPDFDRFGSLQSPQTGVTSLEGKGVVKAIALQPDGKVLIGGYFDSVDLRPQAYLARLNIDGSLDDSFAPGISDLVNNAAVNQIVVQNRRIIVAGGFQSINGQARNSLAALTTDAALDLDFAASGGPRAPSILGDYTAGIVYSLAAQGDGRLIIAGLFSKVEDADRYGIARLNYDGSLDRSFDPGNTFQFGKVFSVAIQANGQILAAFQTSGQNAVVRLNTDGTVDSTFQATFGSNDSLLTIALRCDDEILVGGIFSFLNGVPRAGIAQLRSGLTNICRLCLPEVLADNTVAINIGFIPGKSVIVETSTNLYDWSAVLTNKTTGSLFRYVDSQPKTLPNKFYRARQ